MAVSAQDLFARYPEFADARAPTDMVNATLATATVQVRPEVWGVLTDEGIIQLTAHLLAISPWGQQARLAATDGETTYGKRYRELQQSVTCGLARLACP